MVEELLRWFVADVLGGRELIDELDFPGMLRVAGTVHCQPRLGEAFLRE